MLFISYLNILSEFLIFYVVIHLFLHKSLIPQSRDAVWGLAITLLVVSLPNNAVSTVFFVGQLAYILYIIFCYTKNVIEGLILFTLDSIFILLIQFLLIFLVGIFQIPFSGWYIGILSNLITLLIAWLILSFTGISQVYDIIIHSALPVKLFLVNTYLIYFSVLLTFKIDISLAFNNPAYLFAVASLMLAANVCILYYDRNMQYQKRLLNSYEKNLPIYESLIGEIRSRQHEYSNRLQTLQNLSVSCQDYESLQNALKKYTKEYSHPLHAYPLLQIDMPLLAASLYHLSERAAARDIILHFDVVSEHLESNAPEYVLSDMLCILTQNAIEASKPGDHIYVLLSSADGRVKFEIRNPSDRFYTREEVLQFFQKGYTTKAISDIPSKTRHGLGLYSLHRDLPKYDGYVGADCIVFDDCNWMIFRLDI